MIHNPTAGKKQVIGRNKEATWAGTCCVAETSAAPVALREVVRSDMQPLTLSTAIYVRGEHPNPLVRAVAATRMSLKKRKFSGSNNAEPQ
jgi:hypothetical protein